MVGICTQHQCSSLWKHIYESPTLSLKLNCIFAHGHQFLWARNRRYTLLILPQAGNAFLLPGGARLSGLPRHGCRTTGCCIHTIPAAEIRLNYPVWTIQKRPVDGPALKRIHPIQAAKNVKCDRVSRHCDDSSALGACGDGLCVGVSSLVHDVLVAVVVFFKTV